MKQIVSCAGTINILEHEAPPLPPKSILVRTAYSLISSGTERASVARARRSLVSKAVTNPLKLRQAFRTLQSAGIKSFIEKAQSRDKPRPLGYSSAGIVEKVGDGVDEFREGDLVACAGAGRANHAELASVPVNLATKIPAGCPVKYAATVAAGAIALQGVRRGEVCLGETVAVIGLGLMGQIATQWLQIAGTHVIGFDVDARRVGIASDAGVQASTSAYPEQLAEVMSWTDGHGADCTIIAASSKANEIVQAAMEITRKKGRVVVLGDVGLGLQRSPFYEKELDLVISCSYGAGRYDASYEEDGIDYPYEYVRWTARRNMHEYLRQIAERRINPDVFAEVTLPFERAAEAYRLLEAPLDRPLGILLDYHLNLDGAN